jgi:hypothetical protein
MLDRFWDRLENLETRKARTRNARGNHPLAAVFRVRTTEGEKLVEIGSGSLFGWVHRCPVCGELFFEKDKLGRRQLVRHLQRIHYAITSVSEEREKHKRSVFYRNHF